MHLGPSKKDQYSQRFCTAIILFPFIFPIRPEEHVKEKKDGVRLCNAEKDVPKVNSTVVFLMRSDWSGNSFFWFWKNYS